MFVNYTYYVLCGTFIFIVLYRTVRLAQNFDGGNF